eukprot:scaffold13005_cov63-Phaeocystis_antarctica.AAC.1
MAPTPTVARSRLRSSVMPTASSVSGAGGAEAREEERAGDAGRGAEDLAQALPRRGQRAAALVAQQAHRGARLVRRVEPLQHAPGPLVLAGGDEVAGRLGHHRQREQDEQRRHRAQPQHQPPRGAVRQPELTAHDVADDVAGEDADVDEEVEHRDEPAAQALGCHLGDVQRRDLEGRADAEAGDHAAHEERRVARGDRHEQRADDAHGTGQADGAPPARCVGEPAARQPSEGGDDVEDADEDLDLDAVQLEVAGDEALGARHDADVVAEQEREGGGD